MPLVIVFISALAFNFTIGTDLNVVVNITLIYALYVLAFQILLCNIHPPLANFIHVVKVLFGVMQNQTIGISLHNGHMRHFAKLFDQHSH